MSFWTNYDPLTSYPGSKSLIPNEYGYVLPSGSYYGDALIMIKDLLEESGNFEEVSGSYSVGSHSPADHLIIGYKYPAPITQQYMFLVDSANVTTYHSYTFDESIGTPSTDCICIAGRDTTHTDSPTSFKYLEGSYYSSDGFYCNADDTGGTGSSRSWVSYVTTQDIRTYIFADSNWVVFIYLYVDWNVYKSGHILFRMSEPTDGHYTRADDGAVHGLLELKTSSNYHNRLAGVRGAYTDNSTVFGAFMGLNYTFPEAEHVDEDFIQHLIIGHNETIGCHLGTFNGFYVGIPGINLSIFDSVFINGKEFYCIQRGSPYFTLFVVNQDW